MTKLHIANTHFEWELAHNPTCTLEKSFALHKNFLQMQFLSLLYGDKGDYVFVTHYPPEEYLDGLIKAGFSLPIIVGHEDLRPDFSIESWAPSQIIERFATKHSLKYPTPSFSLTKEISSKVFTHSLCPLPKSALLHNMSELKSWVSKTPDEKVLKSCHGFSGRGHFHLEGEDLHPSIESFAEMEWKRGNPIIGEPWKQRLLDFSSQWFIGKEIKLLGTTLLKTTNSGMHLGNMAAEDPKELFGILYPYVEDHIAEVKPHLKAIAKKGFFGHIGIDAMVYEDDLDNKLHAIIEMNPRKTFGLITLQLQKRFSQRFLPLRYLPKKEARGIPLLPSSAGEFQFQKQLVMELDLQNPLL